MIDVPALNRAAAALGQAAHHAEWNQAENPNASTTHASIQYQHGVDAGLAAILSEEELQLVHLAAMAIRFQLNIQRSARQSAPGMKAPEER